MLNSDVSRLANNPDDLRIFQQERLVVEVSQLMCEAMKDRGIRRKKLAEMLKKSKGRISQILNGETNLTLYTIADIFTALGKTATVSIEDIYTERPILHCLGNASFAMPSRTRWEIEDEPIPDTCRNMYMAS